MSAGLSRAEVEAMSRAELVETIVEMAGTVEDLQNDVEKLEREMFE